tara:strand:- start:404 stop:1351 length:948 start_codon:yes stop_codon:yes gene_type:complete
MRFTVAALYYFTRIKDPVAKRYPLLSLCRSQEVRGTVLLATEGINGTIAGTPEGIASVIDHVNGWPEVESLEVKYSFSDENSFKRLKVKIKNEIVAMRKPEINTRLDAGKYVEPAEWNDLIAREDVMLVDTRNNFEFKIGRFSNAIEPGTDSFHEFPDWADKLASRPDRPSAVAMYCTGGIRCEKATAYMKQVGFDEVYHLKGGILKYLEDVPEDESLWEGECFVFDGRVSLKHGLKEGNYELCYGCQFPISPSDRRSPLFEQGVSCPRCHDSLPDADRARYRERQRQIVMALSRDEQHIGDDANSAIHARKTKR